MDTMETELPPNERPLTLEEWRDEAGLLGDLANKLMTERDSLRSEVSQLTQTGMLQAELIASLTAALRAYYDDHQNWDNGKPDTFCGCELCVEAKAALAPKVEEKEKL